ncbi:MAG TPA: ABC transporter permease [Anaerolineae bacterium]|nr:ABC transporter permease [Anaerolineae bacterium]
MKTEHNYFVASRGRGGAGKFVRATAATAARLFVENTRVYPWSFFAGRIVSSFFTIVLAYLIYTVLFEGQTAASFTTYTGTQNYLTFIVVGVGIMAYANGALLGIGRSLIIERRIGTIDSLLLAPAPLPSFLVGVMLQAALLTTLDFLIILTLSLPFGADWANANWLGFVLIVLVGHIGLLGMAVILAAVMLYLRDTYLTQNTVIAVLYLICGILFPIQYLPDWLQTLARFIPLTATVSLARDNVLLGLDLGQHLDAILGLSILSLIYCALGFILLNRVRRVALEKALS